MDIAILKYNAGNIFSLVNAIERLGATPIVSDNPETLAKADRVVFPGQGEAGVAMAYLRERGLDKVVAGLTQPVLGICVGMQLLCSHSEESDTDCIGVFPERVVRFKPQNRQDKIPAMGWNSLHNLKSPLFAGLEDGDFAYFIHSYYAPVGPHTIATAHYTTEYSAAICRGNFYATQFHPEKSGDVGARIIENFLRI